jgi:hypothetical protein
VNKLKKESDCMKEFLKMCGEINRECDSARKQLDAQFKFTMCICITGLIGVISLMFL